MATRRHGRALALLAGMVASVGLSGCMGQMGLSSMVTKGNLSVVDNRYGRAGVFVLLSPVYGTAATADLFVFNTIEFWSGKNPITGKSPALVDQKLDALIKVNQHPDPSLNKVPLAMLPQGVREVEVSYPDERTAQMEVHYGRAQQPDAWREARRAAGHLLRRPAGVDPDPGPAGRAGQPPPCDGLTSPACNDNAPLCGAFCYGWLWLRGGCITRPSSRRRWVSCSVSCRLSHR